MKLVDKRLLLETRSATGILLLTILLGFLGGVLIVMQAWLISSVIAKVFLGRGDLDSISLQLGSLLLVFLLRAASLWAGDISSGRLAIRIKTSLRGRLYRQLVALGPAYIRDERTGELVNTLTEGIEALDEYYRGYLPQLFFAVLLPLTIWPTLSPGGNGTRSAG
jgi:ATP-binding cassette subfamily C protein CydD